MSQVTVHHPSSYGKSGTVTFPQLQQAGTSQALTVTGLKPSTQHTIDWGDGTVDTQITTNATGGGTTNHTYATAGLYTAKMYEGATDAGTVVGQRQIAVIGTIASDGTVTAGQSESFTFAGLPATTACAIDWGNGMYSGTQTTTAGGGLVQPNIYPAAGTFRVQLRRNSDGALLATQSFTVVAALRSGEEAPESALEQRVEDLEQQPEIPVGFDPGAHTVPEVEEYVDEHPDQAQDLLDAEVAGKNRSSLVAYLESMVPFDPADYTIPEVEQWAAENPDELEALIAAEEEGRARSTLLNHLYSLRP